MRRNASGAGAGDRGHHSDDPVSDAYTEIAPTIRRFGSQRQLDGDDLLQEAFVRMLANGRPAGVANPVRYVLRIARNLLVDRHRSRQRETMIFQPGDAQSAGAPDFATPERILESRQSLGIVLSAIGSLPPRCREAFERHRFDGQSYAVIARDMGISVSMVEKHVAEAMTRLSQALRMAGIGKT